MTEKKSSNENGLLLSGAPGWVQVVVSMSLVIASSLSTVVVRDQFVPPPSDSFGSKDALLLAYELRTEFNKRMDYLEGVRPPLPTRARILYIEKWIRDKDPMYERPSEEW